jgi:hypothetical protein
VPKYVLKYNGQIKTYWDISILIFAVYNSITIPMSFTFNFEWMQTDSLAIVDSTIDLIFLLDIMLVCRTSFLDVDDTGEEITNPHVIGKKYVKGLGFYIDVLSSIPLGVLLPVWKEQLGAFGLLKLVRLSRIPRVIRKLNIDPAAKGYLRIGFLVFVIVIMMHVFACMWFFLTVVAHDSPEEWVPNPLFIFVNTEEARENYNTKDPGHMYLDYLYVAFYMFGVGEVVARVTLELQVVVMILLGGIIVNAVVIGELTQIFSTLGEAEAVFLRKMDGANTAMLILDLDKDLNKEVIAFLNKTNDTQVRQKQFTDLLGSIKPSSQRDVLKFIFSECTKQNEIFEKLIDDYLSRYNVGPDSSEWELEENLCVNKLVCRMRVVFANPEAKIIVQDDPMEVSQLIQDSNYGGVDSNDNIDEFTNMYLIAKGSCTISVKIRYFGEDKEQKNFDVEVKDLH